MHDQMIGRLFNRSERRQQEGFSRMRRRSMTRCGYHHVTTIGGKNANDYCHDGLKAPKTKGRGSAAGGKFEQKWAFCSTGFF